MGRLQHFVPDGRLDGLVRATNHPLSLSSVSPVCICSCAIHIRMAAAAAQWHGTKLEVMFLEIFISITNGFYS